MFRSGVTMYSLVLLIAETIRQKPFEMHGPIDAILVKVSDA